MKATILINQEPLQNREEILESNEVVLAQMDISIDDHPYDTILATKIESFAKLGTIFTVLFCTFDNKRYNILVTSDENAAREKFIEFAKIFDEKGRDAVLSKLRKE